MKRKEAENSKQDSARGDAWRKRELFLFEPKTLALIIVTSVLTLLISFFGEKGAKFFTSVLSPIPEHAPYNGTVFPIQQVPNWVKLTEAERKLTFSALPREKIIPISSYNPARLAIPPNTLKWNNPADDAIRNEKITYPVPYLGSYRLDGVEGTGSHPAVDIKIPEGTPIFAIANGTVIKSEYSSGGFGNHIVIQHNNFPSPDDPKILTTLYSSYSHMSSLSVKVYDVVTKGQLIGLSGSSGTSTTPHLHFQIDNDNPKWHPFWPFSGADMRNAGLSFFEAINAGLNQNVASANTINPLKYVQKYFGDSSLVASSEPEVTQAIAAATKDEYEDLAFVIQTTSGNSFKEGDEIKFIIQAFDGQGNLISKPKFQDSIALSLLNGNATLSRSDLTATYLRTGISSAVKALAANAGKEKLILRFRQKEFSSPEFVILPKTPSPSSFSFNLSKTQWELNETAALTVTALDPGGQRLPEFILEENVTIGMTNSIGNLSKNSLALANFANGEASVRFTALSAGETEFFVSYKGNTVRSQAISVLAPPPPPIVIASEAKQSLPTAPPSPQPIEPPAAELPVPEPVVSAPPVPEIIPPVSEPVPPPITDPATPVTPAPTPEPEIIPPSPFIDVPFHSPYFEALAALKAENLVAGYGDGSFKPNNRVSRAEAITFILRAINETIRERNDAVFKDIPLDAWFAKFVVTAFELGFVKGYPDGTFRPDSDVNIAEFFTMIFIAAKSDIDPNIEITLPDGMTPTDWFAPYIQEALRRGMLEAPDNKLDANRPLTRGEIANILYVLKKLEKEGTAL